MLTILAYIVLIPIAIVLWAIIMIMGLQVIISMHDTHMHNKRLKEAERRGNY